MAFFVYKNNVNSKTIFVHENICNASEIKFAKYNVENIAIILYCVLRGREYLEIEAPSSLVINL